MACYNIPFYNLDGIKHEIRIYPSSEGYDWTTATTLTGGRDPIVTEEDSSSDILSPVRSSTGYINIVTGDYELLTRIMPNTDDGMRVTLLEVATAAIKWEGYIQPQAFTQEWSAGPWEVQIPIISRLGMMMERHLSDGNIGFLSIGEWIHRICGNVYLEVVAPDNSILTNGQRKVGESITGQEYYAITPTALECAFSEELFKQEIPLARREGAQLWKPSKNMDIAVSICTTMRWVLRESGNSLIIDDPAHTGSYRIYTPADITIRGASTTAKSLSVASLEDMPVCNDNGSREVLQPYGRVTLTGNEDNYDTTIMDPNIKDWQKVGGIPLVNGNSDNYSYTLPYSYKGDSQATIRCQRVLNNDELSTYRYYSQAWGAHEVGDQLTGNEAIPSMVIGNWYPHSVSDIYSQDLLPGDYFAGGEVSQAIISYTKDGNEQEVSFSSVILGCINWTNSPTSNPLPAVVIRSLCARCLPWSQRKSSTICLKIEGTAYRGDVKTDIDIAATCDAERTIIPISIKIGDYYLWKDTLQSLKYDRVCSLSNTPKIFYLTWYKRDNGKIDTELTMEVASIRSGSERIGLPVSLDAPIELTFYTPTKYNDGYTSGFSKYLRIDNLRVRITEQEYLTKWGEPMPLADNIDPTINISHKIGNTGLEEYSIGTQFGGIDSPGSLFNSYEEATGNSIACPYKPVTQVGTLPGEDGAKYLCQRTADWLKKQCSTTRNLYKVPVRIPASVTEPMRVNISNTIYMPVSKRTKWADSETELTLIEIKSCQSKDHT